MCILKWGFATVITIRDYQLLEATFTQTEIDSALLGLSLVIPVKTVER
jgi:hypothetical protein